MVLVDNDAFLSELTRMYERTRLSGSVSTTMKRYNSSFRETLCLKAEKSLKKKTQKTAKKQVQQKPTPMQVDQPCENQLLVRAFLVGGLKTNASKRPGGFKNKISTIVGPNEWSKFTVAYGNLVKANMDSLKRKAKKERRLAQASNPSS
eukprot:Sdes_comp15697_c0_seq2m4725